MGKVHSHLNTAVLILKQYQGQEPLASFLKKYFGSNKKFGSRDRKAISHLCYCYFRLGKAWKNMPVENRILVGLYMCSDDPGEYISELRPLWVPHLAQPVIQKAERINYVTDKAETLKPGMIFPWLNELSEGIDAAEFVYSHFQQPSVFLRIRPGFENEVTRKLNINKIGYELIDKLSVSLPNATKLDKIIDLDKEAVVQDLSSQRTGELLKSKIEKRKSKMEVWDCCAGSGGKSIMVYDLFPGIHLTVSDIRESIINNLKKRFQRASIKNYQSLVADLTRPNTFDFRLSAFDLIIADVPCTGSGTWSRTPEQLYYFDPGKIGTYAAKQEKILLNTIPHLKPGGFLLYITCSVFREENEDQVNKILGSGLVEVERKLIKGYRQQADTMFTSLLQKPIA